MAMSAAAYAVIAGALAGFAAPGDLGAAASG
jgi:hypothetical protein